MMNLKLLPLIVAVVFPVGVIAQSDSVPDQRFARLARLALDSSRLERLAHSLLDSIGPRLSGTPHMQRGNDWLVSMYRSWGIEARNERTGTWRGWRRGHSHIDLVSPRVRTLEGTMLGYSPGTRGRDITAETVILPQLADSAAFVRWLSSARGKLVLVAPPKPTCRPLENWVANATDSSRASLARKLDSLNRAWTGTNVRGTGYDLALGTGSLGLRMEKAGIAGMITSRAKDAWGTIEIFETYNQTAPAIALSCEDYGLVYRLTESGSRPRVRLNLDASLTGETPVFNTVATIRGWQKPEEYIVLSSHFDSWDGASGATDNGTGTLMMMEAMRILKLVYPNPRRTIISGHWTAEEQGTHGSRAFAEDHPEIIKGIHVLFNQDNGTGRIVQIGGAGLGDAANHLGQWLSKLPEPWKTQISYTPPGRPAGRGSDDASFACLGVPAFSLGALSWSYGYTWHTNRDTFDKIVFDDLKSNAALAAMLVYLASEDPVKIRHRNEEPDKAVAPWPECGKAGRITVPRL